jgi:superfamily II RNA helicase
MVKICSNIYSQENELIYKNYFKKYQFDLSSFQKYAIQGIIEGNHVLVTAHTGSGKTLPAEFAIEYFVSKGKKIIYTSPIKALSNQKFYDFSKKFPNINFGILTGDIKTNPQADVLIMTAEILLNKLYQNKSITNNNINNSFEMDINNELACVIMDEVHYINDQERGKVWEETILMLPSHIQMVMLSATLDSPEKFASWCENRGSMTSSNKIVYLTSTNERVVPLIHYSYITCNQTIFKKIKDKNIQSLITNTTNKLHIIQDDKGRFNEENYYSIKKVLSIFEDKQHYVKRQHVLNSITKYMYEHSMLPALCFVLSKKTLEQCANEIQTNSLPWNEDDSKIPYIIEHECEQIIRKLPNYKEYLNLPEYIHIVSLLRKGIAIHHAGIMPVLREMIEILFSKGYIKLLFATETFSVGINMPTKSVIFCDVSKFDGHNQRFLYSHEYTQMAGRAGRRGIDNIGYVIHLTNLFKNTDITSIRTMLKGKPQMLVSKFKISYNLLLNLIDINETDYLQYINKSMIQNELNNEIKTYQNNIDELTNKINSIKKILSDSSCVKTPEETIYKYIELKKLYVSSVNKKKKNAERELNQLVDEYPEIENDMKYILHYNELNNNLLNTKEQLHNTSLYLQNTINKTLKIMETNNFIQESKLTLKGKIALQLREVHCLVFSELLILNKLNIFNASELVSLFSCFTNISVIDELKYHKPNTNNKVLNDFTLEVVSLYDNYYNYEMKEQINTGLDYNIHFELMTYCIQWCDSNSEEECKIVLQELTNEKQIYLGEFIKALLKINNICNEFINVLEIIGNIELLDKIISISKLTLKYIATNQSLYV